MGVIVKRNYNLRLIKSKKSYSTQELADLLGTHPQTVRDWHRAGLKPIDSDSTYILFVGSDVKDYLKNMMLSRRVKLKQNEFYCFGCKKASTSNITECVSQNRFVGKGKVSIAYKGVCDTCGVKLTKFSSINPNQLDAQKVIN